MQETVRSSPDKTKERSTLGSYLKEARKEKQMSIEDLSYLTKISQDILRHIENDQFQLLPKGLFVKGFIRSICNTLELDIKLIQKKIRTYDEKSLHSMKASRNRRSPALSQFKKIFLISIGVVVVTVLMFVYPPSFKKSKKPPYSVMIKKKQSKKIGTPPIPIKKTQTTEVFNNKFAKVATVPQKILPSIESSQSVSVFKEKSSELKLHVKHPGKFRIKIDGKNPVIKQYKTGIWTMTFKKKLELLVYDASTVKIFYHQKFIGTLGRKGKIRRISFYQKNTPLKLF